MKKLKILGVLAIALTLGLAACNGGGNGSGSGNSGSSSKHVHTFDTTKWEGDDTAHWHPATCEHTNQKGDKANHEFGDPYDVVQPTCEQAGSQKVKCKVCGKEVVQTLKALGHDWVDDEAGAVAPTCTEAGSKNQTCSRCGQKQEGVVVEALGHDFGEWTQVEGKQPTCEQAGEEKRTCSRCNEVETREVPALGHKFELVGEATDPEPGKATVRVYTCVNGCGQTSLGFRANEVSEASKSHLNFTEPNDKGEVGASFWGRPIGNSLGLDSTGTSVAQQNNEIVYCSTETGDFFEYVFDLTKEQAAELATCRCYCDAMPADHLSGDFWAYNRSNTDWTPGYYIDGADEHVQHNDDGTVMMVKDHARVEGHDNSEAGAELETEVPMGARIEDYRYILYVDDKVQDFDSDISVTVQSGTRKEYVMPFTFHLHEGENKISLRMAGGYRSTFYNFTFRPYVEPDPVVVNETSLTVVEGKTAQITSSMEGLTYASSSTSVATVDDKGVVTGVKAGSATITVSKEGNYKPAKVAVTVTEPEGVITLNLTDGVIAPEGGINVYQSSSSGTWYNTFTKDATITYTFQSEAAGKYNLRLGLRGSNIVIADTLSIKVNNADVALSGTVSTSYSAVEYIVGQADLQVGANTMVITALVDSSLYLKSLQFIPAA